MAIKMPWVYREFHQRRGIMKWHLLNAALMSCSAAAFGQVTSGGGATATSLNVQTLATGNVLSVTPAVSADRRYVGMAIDVQFSTLNGIDRFGVGSTNTGNTAAIPGTALALPRMPATEPVHPISFRAGRKGMVVFAEKDKTLLTAQIPAAHWEATSLKEATRKLADLSKENFALGIRGMQQAGVDVDAKRDFSFPRGTVRDALQAILATATPLTDVVVSAEDKVVQISTQAQADQILVIKTYYLEDILANLPRAIQATHPDDAGVGAAAGVIDLSKPLDLSKPPAPPKKTGSPYPKESRNILEMITDSLRPEIWVNHGGKSEISMVANHVTIKAPASIHMLLDGPKVYDPHKVPLYLEYKQ